MALQDLIQKNSKQLVRGAGGVLEQQTPEEIQSLAGKAGLQAPPTTPLGGAMIGANPDQQKMLGTPAQKQASLAQSTQALTLGQKPQNELSTAVRESQARSQQTQQEQAKQQKSQDLQNLGSVGQRVQDFIQTQRNQLEAQTQQGAPVAVAVQDQFQGKDVSAIKPLLAQLRADPTNQQLMLQVNQALGYDVNTQLDPSQVDQLYGSAVDAISKGASGNIDHDLTVGDLNLGYTPDQLGQLLGVPSSVAAGMTVAQLRDHVKHIQDEEFSKTANLQGQATSANLGQAEQGQAAAQAKEASATGMRSTEADVAHLDQQIAKGDQVQFGGQSYSVEDLLKNDTVSGIVSDYMNSAPGSEVRQRIDQTEPQLSDFISKNQALLEDASKQLQTGATTFQGTQAANKQLSNFGGVQLDDNLAKAVIPGYGELQANQIDPNSVPVLAAAKASSNPNALQTIGSELNAQMQSNPEIAQQAPDLTEEDWKNLGIADNGPNWQKFKQAEQARKEIDSADTPDKQVTAIFSDVGSAADLSHQAYQDYALDVLGGAGSWDDSKLKLVRDPNNPTQILQGDALKAQLDKLNPPPSLKDAADGKTTVFQKVSLGTPTPLDPVEQSLIQKMGPLLQKTGGKITDADIHNQFGTKGLSMDELLWLHDHRRQGNVEQGSIDEAIGNYQNENTDKLIRSVAQKVGAITTSANGNTTNLDKYIAALKSAKRDIGGDRAQNPQMIEDIIKKLTTDQAGAAKERGKTMSESSPSPIQHIGDLLKIGSKAIPHTDPTNAAVQAGLKPGKSAVKKIGAKF